MNKNKQVKEVKVSEIAEKLGKAKSVVIVTYQGITVEQDKDLRKKLRESGIDYKVYKNTLVARAAKSLNIEGLDPYLEGPVSIAFGYENETLAAKLLSDFAKESKKLELKAAYVAGSVLDADGVKMLATIPSKEILIGKFLGSIKSPLSNLVYMLNAVAESKGAVSAE